MPRIRPKAGVAVADMRDTRASEALGAVRRFFSYDASLPPDEYVGDFLRLIDPGWFLNAGRVWVREAAQDEAVPAAMAEVVRLAETARRERRNDLVALAAYALAKMEYASRSGARPYAEKLVALLFSHVHALQAASAAWQRDDPASLVRLTVRLLNEWPGPAQEVDGREAARLLEKVGTVARRQGLAALSPAAPELSSGNETLDSLFRALEEKGYSVAEPFGLVCVFLPSRPARTGGLLGRKHNVPPSVRLTALGYDERNRQGFRAELHVERWTSRRRGVGGVVKGTQIVRCPEALLVPSDAAFDEALARAARVVAGDQEKSSRLSLLRWSGSRPKTIRWSLQRSAAVAAADDLLFASGGSIAGAFAVALRLLQNPLSWTRPRLRCAIVAGLADSGALLAVDPATLKAKIGAAETGWILLAAGQPSDPDGFIGHRGRVRSVASTEEAFRHCLRLAVVAAVRQLRTSLTYLLLLISLITAAWTPLISLCYTRLGREYDASDQFSTSLNPSPFTAWQYGWLQPTAAPDPVTFVLLPRPYSAEVNWLTGTGLFFWYPENATWPYLSFSRGGADLSNPAAAVLWPARALTMSPGDRGVYSCLRFVAPHDGAYRLSLKYWGASTGNYGAAVYVAENNRIVYTHASTYGSMPASRGTARSFVHVAHVLSGQTIDVIVGYPIGSFASQHTERTTGILCHITRL